MWQPESTCDDEVLLKQIARPMLQEHVLRFRMHYHLPITLPEVEASTERAWESGRLSMPPSDAISQSSDLLKRFARHAVEEQVKQIMLSDPASPLWSYCYSWAQGCVCYILGQYGHRAAEQALSPDEMWIPVRENVYRTRWYFIIEDITQEAMLAIAKGLANFRLDSNFDTWRASVVYREVLTYYNVQARELPSVPFEQVRRRADDGFDSEETFDCEDETHYGEPQACQSGQDLLDIIRETNELVRESWPKEEQRVIYQRVQLDKTSKEVEEDTGIAANRVDQIIAKWRRLHRKQLGRDDRYPEHRQPLPTFPAPLPAGTAHKGHPAPTEETHDHEQARRRRLRDAPPIVNKMGHWVRTLEPSPPTEKT